MGLMGNSTMSDRSPRSTLARCRLSVDKRCAFNIGLYTFQAGLQRRGFGRGKAISAQAELHDEAFVFLEPPECHECLSSLRESQHRARRSGCCGKECRVTRRDEA